MLGSKTHRPSKGVRSGYKRSVNQIIESDLPEAGGFRGVFLNVFLLVAFWGQQVEESFSARLYLPATSSCRLPGTEVGSLQTPGGAESLHALFDQSRGAQHRRAHEIRAERGP